MKRRYGHLGVAAVAVVVATTGLGASQAAAAALFAPASSYPVSGYPGYLALGDFTGDGSLDFAVTGYAAVEHVSVLLNNGSGVFGPETNYPAARYPGAVAVGDFRHRDGRRPFGDRVRAAEQQQRPLQRGGQLPSGRRHPRLGCRR